MISYSVLHQPIEEYIFGLFRIYSVGQDDILLSSAPNNRGSNICLFRIYSVGQDDAVSPNKHGNSVTIFNLPTSAQLGCKINVLRDCVPASQAEVDYFNIVTEFPC